MLIEDLKEQAGDLLYEKFKELNYYIQGDFCQDTINALLLDIDLETYRKEAELHHCLHMEDFEVPDISIRYYPHQYTTQRYTTPSTLSVVAGESLTKGVLVKFVNGKVFKFNPDDLNDVNKALGITSEDKLMGEEINILTEGQVESDLFAFEQGQTVFVTNDGALTTNIVENLIIQTVGIALSATKLEIEIGNPIVR